MTLPKWVRIVCSASQQILAKADTLLSFVRRWEGAEAASRKRAAWSKSEMTMSMAALDRHVRLLLGRRQHAKKHGQKWKYIRSLGIFLKIYLEFFQSSFYVKKHNFNEKKMADASNYIIEEPIARGLTDPTWACKRSPQSYCVKVMQDTMAHYSVLRIWRYPRWRARCLCRKHYVI